MDISILATIGFTVVAVVVSLILYLRVSRKSR
jgi:hypothetical protein